MSSSRAIIKSFLAIGDPDSIYANSKTVEGDMSADIVGPVMILDKVDQLGFQVKWTSANAVGVISVQVSNDPMLAQPNIDPDDAQWDSITFDPTLTQPNSDNGQYMINMALAPFSYARVFYDRTSGTGTLQVIASAKGL